MQILSPLRMTIPSVRVLSTLPRSETSFLCHWRSNQMVQDGAAVMQARQLVRRVKERLILCQFYVDINTNISTQTRHVLS